MPCIPIRCKSCKYQNMPEKHNCDLSDQWAIFGSNPDEPCEAYVKIGTGKLEYKRLGQILNEAGAKGVQWKGWCGNSQLILSQEYAAKVFVEAKLAEVTQLLKDVEVGNVQSLDKIAWRLREILGDSQILSQKNTEGKQ